jgi:regulator of RNase E activity RraA
VTLTIKDKEALSQLCSGQISDAMEMLDLRRTVVLGLRLLAPHGARMFGPAYTIRQLPKHASDARKEGFVRHAQVSSSAATAGHVIVVDVGGLTEVASWGEFHTYRSQRNGAAGAIINGSLRDVASIRDSGFPVFCKGFSPIKSRWDLETAAINEPVSVGEVQIRPGDLVFGDESGIVVVPAVHLAAVLEKAMELQRQEDADMAKLRGS